MTAHDGKLRMQANQIESNSFEARPDPRRTVIQSARIVGEKAQALCVVRDISEQGMKARLFGEARIDDRVVIEFKGGRKVTATTAWVKDRLAGFTFDEPIELATIFLAAQPGFVYRSPRLDVEALALVKYGRTEATLPILDVSTSGVKLTGGDEFVRNEDVIVSIEGLVTRDGVVIWKQDGQVGIVFEHPVAVDMLSEWASKRKFTRNIDDIVQASMIAICRGEQESA